MTEASTLAGEKVLGSFRSEITLSKMVLEGNRKVSRCAEGTKSKSTIKVDFIFELAET